MPDQITETIDRFPIAAARPLRRVLRAGAVDDGPGHTAGRAAARSSRSSIFPEAEIGGVRFLPAVTTFPETKGVDAYKDLTPRGGVAYDVFGNGKTALKVSFGRYLEAAQNGGLFIASRPTSRVSTTATRTWTDANRNLDAGLRPV